MTDMESIGIKEFFKGRDIFITGGSGKKISNTHFFAFFIPTYTKLTQKNGISHFHRFYG